MKGDTVNVIVHSLGARATGGGQALLVATDGRTLTSVPLQVLEAPLDLTPKTTIVRLTLPAGTQGADVSVRVALPGRTGNDPAQQHRAASSGLRPLIG